MAENENGKVDPMEENDILKKLRAIGTDLWGESAMAMEGQGTEDATAKKPAARKKTPAVNRKKADIDNLWVTADETIDWTEALSRELPPDGLTSQGMWAFYREMAEDVLKGDIQAYAQVLRRVNPLGDLTAFADGITMRAPSAERAECEFTCREEILNGKGKKYLAAMALRMARDLMACLPVSEAGIKAWDQGRVVMDVTFTREALQHRNFLFEDPVETAVECGAVFG